MAIEKAKCQGETNHMKKGRPNVLFLLTDDQRHDTIHALGNDVIKTPNLDRLVERGTAFTNAYIPGGTTSAVCMPSRAMINSGRTLFKLQADGKDIPKCDTTLGQALKEDGYHCFETGKWHNGVESFTRSFSDGAQIFFGGMWDHWNVPVCDYRQNGVYDKTIRFTPNFSANQTPVTLLADRIHAGVHSTELFTDAAVDFVNGYDGEDPFFMYVAYLAPHDPRTMPDEFKNMYDPADIELPPNFYPMPHINFGWGNQGRDENTAGYPRQPEEIKQHIADYYAMISHADHCIGRIIQALEDKGELDNTIIVFAGDNGLAVGQHGLMGKQNIYDHSIHIPLIMAGPGIPQGHIRDQYVYLLDVYPTLCDLCGVNIPDSVEGKSFAQMFTDEKYVTRKDIYLVFQSRIRGVQNERYKLIEYRSAELKMTQLFDLKNDPWERLNYHGFTGYEEITQQLRKRMEEYRDEWKEEENICGQQFWQQWRNYEQAEVKGMGKPKGSNMANQVKDWGHSNNKEN